METDFSSKQRLYMKRITDLNWKLRLWNDGRDKTSLSML
jgi:hypothetical protein